jgi:hypothetical protein
MAFIFFSKKHKHVYIAVIITAYDCISREGVPYSGDPQIVIPDIRLNTQDFSFVMLPTQIMMHTQRSFRC